MCVLGMSCMSKRFSEGGPSQEMCFRRARYHSTSLEIAVSRHHFPLGDNLLAIAGVFSGVYCRSRLLIAPHRVHSGLLFAALVYRKREQGDSVANEKSPAVKDGSGGEAIRSRSRARPGIRLASRLSSLAPIENHCQRLVS